MKLLSGSVSQRPLRSSVGSRANAPEEAWRVTQELETNILPATIIDVGVGRGTMPLYRAFPDAYHVLVEPLSEFQPYLDAILSQYKGCWIQAAASDEPGKRTLYVEDQYKEMSSFIRRNDDVVELHEREVDVLRITDLVRERKLQGPFILKTDVEGFDLKVLQGASDIFVDTMFVICECRTDHLFGGATLDAISKYLYGSGFGISNLLEVRWETNGTLRWANVVFKNQHFLVNRM